MDDDSDATRDGNELLGEADPDDLGGTGLDSGMISGGYGTQVGTPEITSGVSPPGYDDIDTTGGVSSGTLGTVGTGIPPGPRPGDPPHLVAGTDTTPNMIPGGGTPVGAPSSRSHSPGSQHGVASQQDDSAMSNEDTGAS